MFRLGLEPVHMDHARGTYEGDSDTRADVGTGALNRTLKYEQTRQRHLAAGML